MCRSFNSFSSSNPLVSPFEILVIIRPHTTIFRTNVGQYVVSNMQWGYRYSSVALLIQSPACSATRRRKVALSLPVSPSCGKKQIFTYTCCLGICKCHAVYYILAIFNLNYHRLHVHACICECICHMSYARV